MKLLKIDNKLGQYLGESGDYVPIDKITKDHLLRLVNLTLANNVEFDEYDDEQIQNQAHQIVYKVYTRNSMAFEKEDRNS